MTTQSGIEWTDLTWNPTTGCTRLSPGCKNCYAATMARRLQAMGMPGYETGFALSIHENRFQQPMRRKKPGVWFVNSMSDLFHEDIPDDVIDRIMAVMAQTPHHTYQVLTKRAERLAAYFSARPCPANVWLGVSVEDRHHGAARIEPLRRVNAPVRFLSIEPLLEDLGPVDLSGIHWIIVGGESGPKARPMRPEWVDHLYTQARTGGSLFFFKQWGTWGPDGVKRNKKANGRLFRGRTWDERPATGAG